VFCGDANDLYQHSSIAPSNVSKTVGVYGTASDGFVNFTQFGQRVVSTNFADPMQSFVLGSSTKFADLSATAPNARYIATVKGFLVAGNTYDATNGAQPQRVWWPALNDPTNWPTPGTAAAQIVQSDYQDLYGDSGWVQGVVGNLGTADGAVFMERAIWRMVYVGPPSIFAFYPAEGCRGTPAPGSIAQLGSNVAYLGQDGFYIFDGTNSTPIGVNKFDKTFFADLDQNYMHRVCSAVDPINKIVFWAYTGQGNSGGNPNRILAYNWVLGRGALIDQNCEIIFRALSFGYTLETLPYSSIEAIPFSLDSRVWTGGKILLGGFDASHKLSFFNGSNLAATIETSETEPTKGKLVNVLNARPLVDGGTPSVSVASRSRLIDPIVYNSPTAINSLGECPQRATGRYITTSTTIPAGSTWTHFQGVDIDAIRAGAR
jgi:hypothetical protein